MPSEERDDGIESAGTAADDRLISILESVFFACGEPLSITRLAEVVPGPSRSELKSALAELASRAESTGRGLRLVEVAGGYQLRTAPEHAEWVRRVFQQKPWRLTRATLETLAIVAYKQPITRAEIEAIRGVDVDSVLASLLVRKLVRVLGRKEVIGRPLLYGTTRQFLEVFGLKDLSALPTLDEIACAMPAQVGAGALTSGEESWSSDEDGSEANRDPSTEETGTGGDLLASSSGGTDPGRPRQAERQDGLGARDPHQPR